MIERLTYTPINVYRGGRASKEINPYTVSQNNTCVYAFNLLHLLFYGPTYFSYINLKSAAQYKFLYVSLVCI